MEEVERKTEGEGSKIDSVQVELQDNESNDLIPQLRKLQEENRKKESEFNMQRAKLKELYLQKESECTKLQAERSKLQQEINDLKSEFVVIDLRCKNEMQLLEQKSQEEISSLQRLVQDTVEESSISRAEMEHMKAENSRLWAENRELRGSLGNMGPHVLSQVKKTLVRKLGGDSSTSSSFHQDSVDDNARTTTRNSGKQYAQEEPEVLQSIVVQLQEEMKALKEKLREADDQLHSQSINSVPEGEKSSAEPASSDDTLNKSTSMDLAATPCSICGERELIMQQMSKKYSECTEMVGSLEKELEESREDLKKEAALRKDLEDQWQEKREAHKAEVQQLREQVKLNEQQLLELQQKFLETKDEITKQLQRVGDERERVNKHLQILQADNEYLSGHYLATAEEIENQNINLPDTVEELQELLLRQQIELIQARVGSAYEKKKCVTSLDEIKLLREQLEECNNELQRTKEKSRSISRALQARISDHLLELQDSQTAKNDLQRREVELNRQLSSNRVEIIQYQETIEKLTKASADYKAKIKNMQVDLENSEQVQKDFVKLSQNLQISLEGLRQADTDVRWEDDDDIDNCPTCNSGFTVTLRKIHCRHCGRIYCDKCLTKTVPSGPRKRIARVCDICHTLLKPNVAPYFSLESQ